MTDVALSRPRCRRKWMRPYRARGRVAAAFQVRRHGPERGSVSTVTQIRWSRT